METKTGNLTFDDANFFNLYNIVQKRLIMKIDKAPTHRLLNNLWNAMINGAQNFNPPNQEAFQICFKPIRVKSNESYYIFDISKEGRTKILVIRKSDLYIVGIGTRQNDVWTVNLYGDLGYSRADAKFTMSLHLFKDSMEKIATTSKPSATHIMHLAFLTSEAARFQIIRVGVLLAFDHCATSEPDFILYQQLQNSTNLVYNLEQNYKNLLYSENYTSAIIKNWDTFTTFNKKNNNNYNNNYILIGNIRGYAHSDKKDNDYMRRALYHNNNLDALKDLGILNAEEKPYDFSWVPN